MWFLSRLPRGSRSKGSVETTYTDMRGPVACAVLVQELRKFRSLRPYSARHAARARWFGGGRAGTGAQPAASTRIQRAMAARKRAFDESNAMTSTRSAALNAYGYSG